MKFSAQLPWTKVISDDVLPSQFTEFLKRDISKFAKIDLDKVKVVDLEAANDGGVLMKLIIPEGKVGEFADIIRNTSSPFYEEGTELNKLVDPKAPVKGI